MSNEIATVKNNNDMSVFSSGTDAWELAQRKAAALSKSDLVPPQYKNNVANSLVALEVAQRCNASPLMVMQNLNIIHGRPAWSSTYIIAAINSCGRFEPLKFVMSGEGDKRQCIAVTKDKNGNVLDGPPVSVAMAKAEGWFDKNGSKWKTMPELMLRYRAAAFFGRLYAAEILMGMRSEDEEREVIEVEAKVVETKEAAKNAAEVLNDKIKKTKAKPDEPKVEGSDEPVHF